ncbi:ECF transporter S component [Planctomonas sp. JC2975]|uniref:ECF transporter S component n=1 Tax=Planctomonas sp. JC2975 TaxID=2729626 RepID=UPI001474BCE7|nr:ECF transporter S component [Planctomonas sp. JC2975]
MHATISAVSPRRIYRWRVVDIIVAAVVGVASGVIFWAWGLAWTPLSAALTFLGPGAAGLLAGGWLFAGVIGGLIVRKPGAALFTEVVAGVVEMLIGNEWGFTNFIWAAVEGLGAEIAFAILLYRVWNLGAAVFAGALAGASTGVLDTTFTSLAALDAAQKWLYFDTAVLSGALIAGVLGWLVVRGLAATGALNRFAAGRRARIVDDGDPAGDAGDAAERSAQSGRAESTV